MKGVRFSHDSIEDVEMEDYNTISLFVSGLSLAVAVIGTIIQYRKANDAIRESKRANEISEESLKVAQEANRISRLAYESGADQQEKERQYKIAEVLGRAAPTLNLIKRGLEFLRRIRDEYTVGPKKANHDETKILGNDANFSTWDLELNSTIAELSEFEPGRKRLVEELNKHLSALRNAIRPDGHENWYIRAGSLRRIDANLLDKAISIIDEMQR